VWFISEWTAEEVIRVELFEWAANVELAARCTVRLETERKTYTLLLGLKEFNHTRHSAIVIAADGLLVDKKIMPGNQL
jgi:hypothetical protein